MNPVDRLELMALALSGDVDVADEIGNALRHLMLRDDFPEERIAAMEVGLA
jgi:hypothetical protein